MSAAPDGRGERGRRQGGGEPARRGLAGGAWSRLYPDPQSVVSTVGVGALTRRKNWEWAPHEMQHLPPHTSVDADADCRPGDAVRRPWGIEACADPMPGARQGRCPGSVSDIPVSSEITTAWPRPSAGSTR